MFWLVGLDLEYRSRYLYRSKDMSRDRVYCYVVCLSDALLPFVVDTNMAAA